MAKTLEKLLDDFVESRHMEIEAGTEKDEYNALMKTAVKDKLRNDIMKEIQAEYEQEIIKKVKKDIAVSEQKRKLKELQDVLWSGFLIAFIVGLLVNQATDVISFLKGTLNTTSITSTIWICLVLLAVCLITYAWIFISKVLNFMQEIKNK
ncbi:MAG: hypothetical protein K2M46_10670 [Lachnospiraceae bacterium]|nr:hypothetical protein [Lachnospiraceae bacterium]